MNWFEAMAWMRHPKMYLLSVFVTVINLVVCVICIENHNYRGAGFNAAVMLLNGFVAYYGYRNQDKRVQEIAEEKAEKRRQLIELTIGKDD